MYLMRLDDMSAYRDIDKWDRVEIILDKYSIMPIFGIIPDCKDPDLLKYTKDKYFWENVHRLINKGWIPAMHGYQHVFESNCGGINPVNNYSEFAGLPYEKQAEKIRKGYEIFKSKEIDVDIFFAPAHTFDTNTLKAIISNTNIRVINDTVANNVYFEDGLYFIPQQSGRVRRLPFKVTTFCYHPNIMKEKDFCALEKFLINYCKDFCIYDNGVLVQRKRNIYDKILKNIYFNKIKLRRIISKTSE